MTEQVLKAVESIKLAYLSHEPIVWLVTGDKEVASKIVEKFTIEHFGSFDKQMPKGIPHIAENADVNIRPFNGSTINTPCVYYRWHGMVDNNILKSIENHITAFEHLITEGRDVRCMEDRALKSLQRSIAIIASPSLPPESWVTKYIEVIYVEPLQDIEIRGIILTTLNEKGIKPDNGDRLNQLVVNLRGFSSYKIEHTINRCITSGFFDHSPIFWDDIFREIRHIKRQLLDGFVGLKWIDLPEKKPNNDKRADESKSLEEISTWLKKRRKIFSDTEKYSRMGYDIPKGVLITGIPGTGKSMMAKESAKMLGLPLISLDMGELQKGIVGASEQHMVEALRMVEAMAPCVLWIDEIEKAFSGSSHDNSDGGVMRRMFGKFLTWMQEKSAPCFVFATSNDTSKLPPELFRSERFDDKFYSFMPTVDECASIFSSIIKEENKKYAKNNPDDSEACLFSKVLTEPATWKEFLNEITSSRGEIKMAGNKWADGKVPQYKLFTGADISMVIKLVKFELLETYEGRSSNFSRGVVMKTTKEVLKTFLPYGETNLSDIADCVLRLLKNRFRSASSSTVINFEDYNVKSGEMSYTADRYTDSYNAALYAAVVGAINFYTTKKDK